MESYVEFKKMNIKSGTCYYFDEIIKIEDFNFDNILINQKSCEKILFDDVSYKTLIGTKPLRHSFDSVKGFVRVYDGTMYLELFGPQKYDAIFNRIRYLISQNLGITCYIAWLCNNKSGFIQFFSFRKTIDFS